MQESPQFTMTESLANGLKNRFFSEMLIDKRALGLLQISDKDIPKSRKNIQSFIDKSVNFYKEFDLMHYEGGSTRKPYIAFELLTIDPQCNIRNEIAVIKELTPTLLLVPSTKGKGDTDFLIKDLIKAANAVKADVLNFTHFGFIQNKLPIYEIQSILDVLFDENFKSSIRVIIWDIDFRFKKEMKQMWSLKNSKM